MERFLETVENKSLLKHNSCQTDGQNVSCSVFTGGQCTEIIRIRPSNVAKDAHEQFKRKVTEASRLTKCDPENPNWTMSNIPVLYGLLHLCPPWVLGTVSQVPELSYKEWENRTIFFQSLESGQLLACLDFARSRPLTQHMLSSKLYGLHFPLSIAAVDDDSRLFDTMLPFCTADIIQHCLEDLAYNSSCHLRNIQKLIIAGANPLNRNSHTGEDCIMLSASAGNKVHTEFFIQYGDPMRTLLMECNLGWTALLNSTQHQSADVMNTLLRAIFQHILETKHPDFMEPYSELLLCNDLIQNDAHFETRCDLKQILDEMVYEIHYSPTGINRASILEVASEYGSIDVVNSLVLWGADVNQHAINIAKKEENDVVWNFFTSKAITV